MPPREDVHKVRMCTLCASLLFTFVSARQYTFGRLIRSQSRYEEAGPLYERALAINQETWGNEHPRTLTSRAHLAELYAKNGKQRKAAQLWYEVISARERVLGPDHPEVASALNSWANLLYSQVGPLCRVTMYLPFNVVVDVAPLVVEASVRLSPLPPTWHLLLHNSIYPKLLSTFNVSRYRFRPSLGTHIGL